MRKISWIIGLACMFLLLTGSVFAEDLFKEYTAAVAKHYELSDETLAEILKHEFAPEDLPVIAATAAFTKGSPVTVAELRARGDSWNDIFKARTIKPNDIFMLIGSKITSKTYTPIFAKYTGKTNPTWDVIALTDTEIVNLVNLKFISSFYDYSVFEIMAMRDVGKDFVKINAAVKEAKKKLLAEEKMKRKKEKEEAAAKAKETEKTGE